ncbi:hypothetical protein [Corynebacterium propinquum]
MNPKRAFTRKPHRDSALTSSTLTPGTLTSPKISPSRPGISRTLRLAGSFRRTSAAASILAASLTLSGCEFSLETIAEPFGPTPDETLVSMAFSAEDEAAAFAESDPGFSELRAQQASELFGEIARICGHHPDGSAPATCAVDRTERSNYDGNHHIANTPDQALHQLVESLADAPQPSQALLIEQAVTVAKQLPNHEDVLTAAVDTLRADEASLPGSWTDMPDWEYQLGTALEAARAFTAGAAATHTEQAAAHSDARLALLRQFGGELSERALTYQGHAPSALLPGDATAQEASAQDASAVHDGNAVEFVTTALQQTSQQWKHRALSVPDTEWIILAVLFAAETNQDLG